MRTSLDTISELRNIIGNKNIITVYQPIVDLQHGSIMGYEALSRGPVDSRLHSPLDLFGAAEKCNMVFKLEQLCRELALKRSSGILPGQRLFVNISANVVHDAEFRNGATMRHVLAQELRPSQVTFEITEQTAIDDFSSFRQSIHHYRRQGYGIAVDDAGAGYSNLQAIAELHPDYIKVDISLVRDIHKDPIKQAIIAAIVKMANAINSRVIAEGIETEEELTALCKMGVHYGQGYYLARPGLPLPQIAQETKRLISDLHDQEVRRHSLLKSLKMKLTLGDIVQQAPTIRRDTTVCETEQIMIVNHAHEVIVLQDEHPVGIVMKHNLYYNLGKQGKKAALHLPADKIMDRYPLVFDSAYDLEDAAEAALSRHSENINDPIIVTQDTQYLGVVEIINLLDRINKIKLYCAQNSNPLTGLPGNPVIEERIKAILRQPGDYILLFVDVSNFKLFNYQYGYAEGDQLIIGIARILRKCLAERTSEHDFIGHFGGDDFVMITRKQSASRLSRSITEEFNRFLDDFMLQQGNLYHDHASDQHGKTGRQGISLSIAGLPCDDAIYENYDQLGKKAVELKRLAKARQELIVEK